MTAEEYRALRESLGSQQKVAGLLDVSLSTISQREQGRQRVRLEAEYAIRFLANQPVQETFSQELSRLSIAKAQRKAEKKRRRDAEFARAYHSPERVRFISMVACVVPACMDGPSENCHAVGGGTSRKADYYMIFPACHRHHLEQHRIGKRSFEKKYGVDLVAVAYQCEAVWQENQRLSSYEATGRGELVNPGGSVPAEDGARPVASSAE